MISITKLYCGKSGPGDKLRYQRQAITSSDASNGADSDRKPIVVWNSTDRCNLNCIHCYANADNSTGHRELTTEQARNMIRQLADFGVPVLLFSGGEPLLRADVYDNAALANSLGIRTVLSTNGTLITEQVAEHLKQAGFSYIGISLDGIGDLNDEFRGKRGAFESAKRAFEICAAYGLRSGLRMTLTRYNYNQIEQVFEFVEQQRISRVCFYHLVYSGRGSELVKADLSHEESRRAVDLIINYAADFNRRGLDVEILTVDNHCDGPFLYMRMLRERSPLASEALQLLKANGGNSSGIGIAAIDKEGNVHPDQFWRHYSLGNVMERPFGDIWTDTRDPILAGLRHRKSLLRGRCASCRWLDICNGNFRVRAEAVYGDVWYQDPACYLTDKEIGAAE
ncbi:MAG: radical SAM protein [Armatimonadota bacterium]|nr:radical SAM protein [Armatimonadota bacterium]